MKKGEGEKYFSIFYNCSKKPEEKGQENFLKLETTSIPTLSSIEKKGFDDLNMEAKKKVISTKIVKEKSEIKAPKKINYFDDNEANDNIKKALESYNNKDVQVLLPNGKKKTIRNVSDYYGVPKSTLSDRKMGKYSVDSPPSIGRKPVFNDNELADIVNHLIKMAEIGYGYTPLQLTNLIRYLSDKYKNKPNFICSRKYLANLLIKFPELSLRKASTYDYQRAKALTEEIITKFFHILETAYNLTKELSHEEIEPKNIWSLDEVGFKVNDQKNLLVMSKKGEKNAHTIVSSNTFHVSVIFCTNATGYTLPPYFIIKGNQPDFIENCKNVGFRRSPIFNTPKAFLNFKAFTDFTQFFLREGKFNQTSYSVLVLDGHKSHTLNLEALQLLNKNKVFTVCIPSHTSHVFNIGDRTVFGNMKKYLRESCLNFLRNKTGIIKIQDFPFIFKEVWNKSVNQQGIMKGKRFNIIIHDFSF